MIMSVLDERERMRREAKDQPFNRGRLADRATQAGQAITETNLSEANKWFALAAEIRGEATTLLEPVVEEKPTPAKGETYFDQHRDEILADRLSIGHGCTLSKWKISLVTWVELKSRWVNKGVVVANLQFASRRLTSGEAIEKVKEVKEPTPPVGEEHEKAEVSAQKIYSCKRCDFKTPDKNKLVGHYSSVHSWWHEEEKEQQSVIKSEPLGKLPRVNREYALPEVKPNEFCLVITGDDLVRLDDEQFRRMWLLLGCIIRNRTVDARGNRVESDIEL